MPHLLLAPEATLLGHPVLPSLLNDLSSYVLITCRQALWCGVMLQSNPLRDAFINSTLWRFEILLRSG